VIKENQAMIELSSRDFSFIEEKPIADLFHLFEKAKNKTQPYTKCCYSV
jgi:hypothetical protein